MPARRTCPLALDALVRKRYTALTDAHSDTALRRVWRCEHFSGG